MTPLFYRTLFAELATLLGMPPFEPDAAGVCNLMLSDRLPVSLVCDDARERLLLVAAVDLPASVSPQELLSAALNPLHSGGPGLGMDDGQCIAWQSVPRSALDAKRVFTALTELVQWVERWQRQDRRGVIGQEQRA